MPKKNAAAHPARKRRTPGGQKTKAVPRRTIRRAASLTAAVDAREIGAMRRELTRLASRTGPSRWNANPDEVQRSVIQLVLTLVEFIRRLLERQAIRRMEGGTLTKKQTENVGLALMRLEETIRDIAEQFDIPPEELNLDLGPVGKLM
jgi:hypothetical protein